MAHAFCGPVCGRLPAPEQRTEGKYSAHVKRTWLRFILGFAACALVVLLLIQAFAQATWFLSRAAQAAAPATVGDPAHPEADRRPVGHHRVREWPPEAGRAAFRQAPLFDAPVAAGELPPVAERLPENPLVIEPPEQCGPYGGTWARFST
ncbi:MAG: hypothetical protein JXR94_21995, partial [Candidatus Hydrogenedentes bacterium]|nr:hypothetical protein [Candidatus Hydrogenedentota bacterium]